MQLDDDKLLLAEYAHFSDGIFKNEETGERRIEFFITIATAALGGVVLLITSDHVRLTEAEIRALALAALLSLFLMGLVTFLRILQRDKVTKEYKAIQDYLRERLRERSVSLNDYRVPFARSRHKLVRGGLALNTAVINSFTLALFVAEWTYRSQPGIVVAVACFIVSFLAHAFAIAKTSGAEESQFFRAGAGAIILNGKGQVLALKRKKMPNAWQLPQGGLELLETPLKAAFREVEEETGINKNGLRLLSGEPILLHYELPCHYRTKKTGRGQINYWFLFRYDGSDAAITLGDKKEFDEWKWTTLERLAVEVVAFRRNVYEQLRKWPPVIEALSPESHKAMVQSGSR